jgi:ubiquinone/menaquinone biosynthesis C-methylase UbiE
MLKEKSRLATQQNYDRLSRWYDSFYASERLFTKTGLRLLDAQPGEKILEIGFGTGHVQIELVRAAGETGRVCGIDLSAGMFAIARRRVQRMGMEGRIFLLLGDAIRLPFPTINLPPCS